MRSQRQHEQRDGRQWQAGGGGRLRYGEEIPEQADERDPHAAAGV